MLDNCLILGAAAGGLAPAGGRGPGQVRGRSRPRPLHHRRRQVERSCSARWPASPSGPTAPGWSRPVDAPSRGPRSPGQGGLLQVDPDAIVPGGPVLAVDLRHLRPGPLPRPPPARPPRTHPRPTSRSSGSTSGAVSIPRATKGPSRASPSACSGSRTRRSPSLARSSPGPWSSKRPRRTSASISRTSRAPRNPTGPSPNAGGRMGGMSREEL